MKKLILVLATAFLAAGPVFANVTIRTDGAPIIPGTVLHLSWQRPSPTQKSDVDVSYDLGSTWTEIATDLELDRMDWTIPAVRFEALQFRVRTQKEVRTEREIGELLPRDRFIKARGYSKDGSVMYAIETYGNTCKVLRTDLTTLTTVCLWKNTTSSGWGRISPDSRFAVLSTGGLNAVAIDLQTGAATQRSMRIHDLHFMNGGTQFAALESGDRLSIIETSTLNVVARWQLERSYQRALLFAFNDRCYVRRPGSRTLMFTASDTAGTDCGAEIAELANGWGYNIDSMRLVSLSSMTSIDDVGGNLVLIAASNDGQFGVFRSYSENAHSVSIVDRTTHTVRRATLDRNPQVYRVFISDDGRNLLQHNETGTSIYDLSTKGLRFVANVESVAGSISPQGSVLSFPDGAAYAHELDGTMFLHKVDLHSAPISISDNGDYALSMIGPNFVVVDTKTSDHFVVLRAKGNGTIIRWSADGKQAAILHAGELHIIDLSARSSRLVAEAGISSIESCHLVATPDLDILVPIWNGRRALVWRNTDGASSVAINNGLNNTVSDCKIDKVARRVYFFARLINGSSPLVLVYTDVDNPHYVRPLSYKASSNLIPTYVHSYAVNDRVGYVLTFEQTAASTTRASAWDLKGELIWTKNYQLSVTDIKGVFFSNDMQNLVFNFAENTNVFDALTGDDVHGGRTYLLGDVLGGRAYLSRHSTTQAPGSVQIHLCAQTLSEFIPLPYVVRDRWSIRYARNTLIYNTDSTWMIVNCPAAELDEAVTMYSVPMKRSIISSVRIDDENLQIEAETSGLPVSATVIVFDLQGRMLAEHKDVELRSGSTHVYVGGEQLPRQLAVQIHLQGLLPYSRILHR